MYEDGHLPMYMLTWPDNRKIQGGGSLNWQKDLDSLNKINCTIRSDLSIYQLASSEARNHVSIFSANTKGRTDVLKSFSFQYSRKLGSRLRAGASIGYGERSPSATELYGFYLFNANDGYDYIGCPELKLEKSLQADIHFQYSWKNNRIQVSTFHSYLMDYIQSDKLSGFSTMTIGAKGVKTYNNIDHATIKGLEASAAIRLSSVLDIVTTAKYLYGKDDQELPLALIAPFKNISSLRGKWGAFNFRVEEETASQQTRFRISAGEDATSGYTLVHLRGEWITSWRQSLLTLQGGVENLFDIYYHEHLDWGNIPRPGRNWYLQLKIGF